MSVRTNTERGIIIAGGKSMSSIKVNTEWDVIIVGGDSNLEIKEVDVYFFNKARAGESVGPVTMTKPQCVSLLKELINAVETA